MISVALKLPQDCLPPSQQWTRKGKRTQFHDVFSPLWSFKGRRPFPLWPAGCPVYRQTVLEKMIPEQGKLHDWTKTERLSSLMPVWTYYRTSLWVSFYLQPVFKDPLQWYLVMSLQVDKADLSWHVHGPLKIGYLKWRLPCYRAFIFVGFPPWFPGRNITLRMSGTPNRGLPTYKSVTWQDLKCPCLVPRNEFQTLP